MCLVYILNLIIQDILKALIKDTYSDLNNHDVYNIENDKEEELEVNSKL